MEGSMQRYVFLFKRQRSLDIKMRAGLIHARRASPCGTLAQQAAQLALAAYEVEALVGMAAR